MNLGFSLRLMHSFGSGFEMKYLYVQISDDEHTRLLKLLKPAHKTQSDFLRAAINLYLCTNGEALLENRHVRRGPRKADSAS